MSSTIGNPDDQLSNERNENKFISIINLAVRKVKPETKPLDVSVCSQHSNEAECLEAHDRVQEKKDRKLTEQKIVSFCTALGMKLFTVDPFVIPRFRLDLGTINYGLLICKALYIQREYDGYMSKYITLPPELKI